MTGDGAGGVHVDIDRPVGGGELRSFQDASPLPHQGGHTADSLRALDRHRRIFLGHVHFLVFEARTNLQCVTVPPAEQVDSPMDMGADVSWLSVFPTEKEVLYLPFTFLKPIYSQPIKVPSPKAS